MAFCGPLRKKIKELLWLAALTFRQPSDSDNNNKIKDTKHKDDWKRKRVGSRMKDEAMRTIPHSTIGIGRGRWRQAAAALFSDVFRLVHFRQAHSAFARLYNIM